MISSSEPGKLRRSGPFTTEKIVKIERKAMVNLLGQPGHFCETSILL